MDQLIQQITQKTGISDEQARQAVQIVVNFVKERLPAPLASQLDSVLGSQQANDVSSQALNSLGGMFGNK